MSSPYSVTQHKCNIAKHPADRIEQDVIHIKTAYPRDKLNRLYGKAQEHTVEKCFKKASRPARHGNEKAIGHKYQDIPEQIGCNNEHAKLLPVSNKPSDLFKQFQIVSVLLRNLCPAVPLGQEQKINQKPYI